MKVCPFCAEEVQDAAVRCKHCQADLVGSKAKWQQFRLQYEAMSPDEKRKAFNKLNRDQQETLRALVAGQPHVTEGRKNRMTAALLAIFLGGIGIHKFYLGRGFQGLLYLVFCWTFIPAFLGLIEGIVYISMSDVGFARQYG
jgi:TM2 domain-containing membrane protein YozV